MGSDEFNPELREHIERLAVIGELFSETAHEIRNLMQSVVGLIEVELAKAPNPKLQIVLDDALLAGEIASNLLSFSAQSNSPGDVNVAVESVLLFFRRRFRHGLEIRCRAESVIPMVSMPTSYVQLIVHNLIKNAVEACNTSVNPRIEVAIGASDGWVTLDVWNSGPYIPPEVLPKLFQRFVTTKKAMQGSGLGLAASARLIEQAHGRIEARNMPGGGVLFRVFFPTAVQVANIVNKTTSERISALSGRRVLIVDDDVAVQDVLRLMIEHLGGGKANVCASADEALSALCGGEFDAILLDLRMRGMSGQELFLKLSDRHRSRVVFVTGDTQYKSFLDNTGQPSLTKPVHFKALISAINGLR